MLMSNNINLSKLLFTLKFLNFKLINGMLETIKKETTTIIPYRKKGLNNFCVAHPVLVYIIRGKDANVSPAAGEGTPLKK